MGLLFGWHDWSDYTYLRLVFGGVVIALFEGEFLLRHLRDEQRQNTLVLERLEEEQRQHRLLLERLGAEQEKLGRQQTRETIVLEGILANMPTASDNLPSDDCGPS